MYLNQNLLQFCELVLNHDVDVDVRLRLARLVLTYTEEHEHCDEGSDECVERHRVFRDKQVEDRSETWDLVVREGDKVAHLKRGLSTGLNDVDELMGDAECRAPPTSSVMAAPALT
jgi:hypothetical protein